jgi:hypothetical protein
MKIRKPQKPGCTMINRPVSGKWVRLGYDLSLEVVGLLEVGCLATADYSVVSPP